VEQAAAADPPRCSGWVTVGKTALTLSSYGNAGDAINALLAAAGQNLRLVLSALALWLAFLLAAMATATGKSDTSSSPCRPKASMA
jgi:hypothetical protein